MPLWHLLYNRSMPLTQDQKFGLLAENYVTQWLQDHHIDVYQPIDFSSPHDALIEGFIPIETKASRAYEQNNGRGTKRLRWQFCLDKPLPDHGLVILACYTSDDIYLFFVPTWFLKLRQTRSLTITSHPSKYTGWLAQFLFSIKTIYNVIGIAKRYSPLWVSFLD